jgi:hypothetical protein
MWQRCRLKSKLLGLRGSGRGGAGNGGAGWAGGAWNKILIIRNIRIKIIRDRWQINVSILHLNGFNVGFGSSNINFFLIFVNNFNDTGFKNSTDCKRSHSIWGQFFVSA